MKHQGRAMKAAAILLARTAVVAAFLMALAWWVSPAGSPLSAIVGVLALTFAGFVLWFFRDPNPRIPQGTGLIVAPAHGIIDVVDRAPWPGEAGGECHRISIFLSVFDVHVQRTPVSGQVESSQHNPGLFLNALKTESASQNENVLIVLAASEPAGARVAVRLIAGLIARRIIPWLRIGDQLAQGERISLIQFGSRVDLFLPLGVAVEAQVGQRVAAGETVVARWTPLG